VSDEVRDRLVRQTQELRGERVAVAILFSDIRSYSTFSEGRDPALVVAQLNAYFDRMVGCIRAEGGMVDKFIGDAVMAVFGGVAAVDEPCQSALRAARRMRGALAELNHEWTEQGESTFEHGIGIAYGDVVQGPLGSAERKEFTVIGDPVNVASRIEGLTKTHSHAIIVTDEVASRLDEATRGELVSLGAERVKGKLQPVEIHGVKE
jgi:class 3 adenylate cyclase